MKTLVSWILVCGVLLVAATSRSDVASAPATADPALPPTPIDEPITGEPITPVPSSAQPPKDPFAPYDTGPPSATWRYQDLSAAEKQLADKGRNVDGWDAINSAFATASGEQAKRAAAAAAANQLGVANLADTGVVP